MDEQNIELIEENPKKHRKKRKWVARVLLSVLVFAVLWKLNYIPHDRIEDRKFGIHTYRSRKDMDHDFIDDQTDILKSAKKYLDTKPQYMSVYYASGYPDDQYGVCTDVVGFALKGAGYNLMELVNQDILDYREDYSIDQVDSHIDFRRVKNLLVYFRRNAISLTTDVMQIAEWQAGDIVVWGSHIGLISDKRNEKGIPYVLHHANPEQTSYEEDILENWGEILGHFRIS